VSSVRAVRAVKLISPADKQPPYTQSRMMLIDVSEDDICWERDRIWGNV